jgi:Rps23 Pro-64 3,4-dihydroxylase Tpa1-like proline 4-hydroxylase
MSFDSILSLTDINRYSQPFEYFTGSDIFCDGFDLDLLEWLEQYDSWKLVEKDFYEQYEFSFFDVELPSKLSRLTEGSFLDGVRAEIEQIFQTSLSSKIDFSAHKLISGQRIRIHNDFIEGQESHRLLIQLNRGWVDENGGLLMLFNSGDPNDIHKIFSPVHNSAVALEISPNSNHAVSTVYAGGRYTLVFSFYRE